jgi:hypothetical protein
MEGDFKTVYGYLLYGDHQVLETIESLTLSIPTHIPITSSGILNHLFACVRIWSVPTYCVHSLFTGDKGERTQGQSSVLM